MEEKKNEHEICYSDYPKSIILGRIIFLLLIFCFGIFVFYKLKAELSYVYILYSLTVISLVLPLSRCVYCHYHGKYCNVGWGKIAGFLFPRREEDNFTSGYSYMLFIYPIWSLPLLVSLLQLLRYRNIFWLALSCIYITILFLEKVYLKTSCCAFCYQEKICPGVPFNSKKKSPIL